VVVALVTMAVAGPAPVAAVEPPAPAGEAQPADAAEDALAARRAELTAALGARRADLAATEAAIGETGAVLAGLERDLARLTTDRAATVARLEGSRRDREVPVALRREIAIVVYVTGDPYETSLLQEIIDANATIEAVADRELYLSVREWADANLARLDEEIATAEAELAGLDAEIPRVEDDMAARRAEAAEALERRDRLRVEVAELERDLRALDTAVLTGLPVDAPSDRPVLIVKIDDAPGARPQQGLNQADVVIEERVEGGLARFAALFQSTVVDEVGPIRSARTSDVHLFANLGAPLFAYSGSNLGVGGALAASNLVDVGAPRVRDAYRRSSQRRAPHNLYADTVALWLAAEGSRPTPLFEFRADGQALGAGARPAAGVVLTFGSTDVEYTWNPAVGGWERTTDGRPHVDADRVRVAPPNVVVRFVEYRPSPADARSPEAVVTGSGEVWVLTAGQVVVGRWEQPTPGERTRYLDAAGAEIRLTPGRTWVALPAPGDAALR